ncbi:polysaccharide deacetylase family protein [Metabacillus idriensis]|uniref:polysaccharide deacetylase family protein n=1 Tax=Metabacillus idriensis TaxID=324768 RepID=UPI002813B01F|nr:polysaccharide deacetylase family protein [Metabacillus idriensis]MDR0137170.1 polysaccharide deacetylase family protein [Metabacillus idriensis]
MKHLYFILAAVCLLSACSSNQTGNETSAPAEADKQKEEQKIEKPEKPEVKEDKETEEAAAEPEAFPKYKLDPANWSIKPLSAEVNAKAVLVTIDDAPDKHSLEMARTLKDLGAGAIFFVNGHFLDTDEEKKTLKEIHDLGFPIGNHTMSHANLKDLTAEEQEQEIVELNDLVESIIGERPHFFRAPFGSNTDESRKIAGEEKMVLMNWTYGYDWEKDYQSKDALTDIMVNSPFLIDGANLLMHDREWTNEALKGIIEGLKAKGYEIADPDSIEKIS